MRHLVIIRADDSGTDPPPEGLIDAMLAHVADHTHAEVVTDAGLAPLGSSLRVASRGGHVTVTDGPFAEAKEVVGGFMLIDAPTPADAAAWARGFVDLHAVHWPGLDLEVEVRQVAGSLTDPTE